MTLWHMTLWHMTYDNIMTDLKGRSKTGSWWLSRDGVRCLQQGIISHSYVIIFEYSWLFLSTTICTWRNVLLVRAEAVGDGVGDDVGEHAGKVRLVGGAVLLEVEKNNLKLKYFIICLDPLVVALQQGHVLVHRVDQVLQGLLVVVGTDVVLLEILNCKYILKV